MTVVKLNMTLYKYESYIKPFFISKNESFFFQTEIIFCVYETSKNNFFITPKKRNFPLFVRRLFVVGEIPFFKKKSRPLL